MKSKILFALSGFALLAGFTLFLPCPAPAGGLPTASGYSVLAPIRHGNLTVFPVVGSHSFDTKDFLTLDEGLRSGQVIVTESGSVQPLMRRRQTLIPPGPQVNQLVLVNNSNRPLILLAGEIVTGGKQDRVIGKDRIISPESDPIDLGVFCVEPGRWVGTSDRFGVKGAIGGPIQAPMAAPNVRAKAMADKDQQQVWSEVGKARIAMSEAVPAPAAPGVRSTSSYAGVMGNQEVKQRIDSVAEPIQRNYQSLIRQLREQNAVGVVVAVNGRIVWADIFASTELLEKYWPKLVQSYAAEAFITHGTSGEVEVRRAQEFINHLDGRHETVDSEPGLYRHTEIAGDGFRAFELTSLLPKT
ncbi:MAG: ARPP-1 family domain-containing protein, partial [Terriglobales bacterium]